MNVGTMIAVLFSVYNSRPVALKKVKFVFVVYCYIHNKLGGYNIVTNKPAAVQLPAFCWVFFFIFYFYLSIHSFVCQQARKRIRDV